MAIAQPEKTFQKSAYQRFQALLRSTSGATAISFAIALPAILGAAGVAVDFGNMSYKKAQLQSAADQAAVAGAKELGVANAANTTVQSAAENFAKANLQSNFGGVKTDVAIDRSAGSVEVNLSHEWTPFFAQFLGADMTPIHVRAKAGLAGSSNICVLTLDESGTKALYMDKRAKLQANGCGVYSNSKHTQSIRLDQDSEISAALICAVGGVKAKTTSVSPQPITDCPAIADPLADRAAPAKRPCSATKTLIKSGTVTLNPGVYCDGLKITGTADVKFNPGTYVIRDGPFEVSSKATATGVHVGFYLEGEATVLKFGGSSTISFTGETAGPLAGLLFFEDRSVSQGRQHELQSIGIKELTGTIYLSRGILHVDPNANVAGDSDYTAIITHRLELNEGPTLIMNSNYGASDVPVPAGIRVSSQVVMQE
jgi:Putative Flp pilus-assembly TadE/G-like